MGFAGLLLLHGLEGLVDEAFGLLVRLCWLTAIFGAILCVKGTIHSVRNIAPRVFLLFATLLSFVLLSVVCMLLLPDRFSNTTTSPLDPRPLVDLASAIVWLTISLDIWAMVKLSRSESGSVSMIMLVLFLPIVGATYFLMSNRRVTQSVPTADTRDK
jgi:hypothetical protein